VSTVVPEGVGRSLAPWLFRQAWFVRRVVLDRGFFHAGLSALAPPVRL
jgi:hypothetical protein